MKKKLHFLIAFCTLFFSCSDPEFSDERIEQKAIAISRKLDASSAELFIKYNLHTRGGGHTWVRQSSDSSKLYTCRYEKRNDTTILTVFNADKFREDFHSLFPFDKEKGTTYTLIRFQDSLLCIIKNKNGENTVQEQSIPLKKVFPLSNPVEGFATFSSLADSLGIQAISSNISMGNFVEFHLSPYYILTYTPAHANIDPTYKAHQMEMVEKSKILTENWTLYKLKNSKDNG